MKKEGYATMALTSVCLLLGVLIGVQYNTVKKQNTQAQVEVQRVNEMTGQLRRAQEEIEDLKLQIAEKEERLSGYESAAEDDSELVQSLQRELSELKSISGFADLTGPGVTVMVNDSSAAGEGEGDVNAYLVHAEDILSLINELNVAGAEAVSINGQRIIGSSSVRCAGSVVNINGVKIATPFVITAIGSPDVLESALRFPGGVIDSLSPWGIEIEIEKHDKVTVPAYNQSIRLKEARTAETEG